MNINKFSRACWRKNALINRTPLLNNNLQLHQLNSGLLEQPQRLSSSVTSPPSFPNLNMKIVPVPVRSDNYAYLIIDEKSKTAAVVDPFDPEKVMKAAEAENVNLSGAILTTHHHLDHSGGNVQLASILRSQESYDVKIRVYGGSSKIPGLTNLVQHGHNFMLMTGHPMEETETSIQITCMGTPCHTRDSFCFYVKDLSNDSPGSVFTGDTLFNAGCGRFFEGNADDMNMALCLLASLPSNTITYPGHEYTKSNIAFARSIEPENPYVLEVAKLCAENHSVVTTGKYTIADERRFNPFMRLEEPSVLKAIGLPLPPDILHYSKYDSSSARTDAIEKLREMKNSFRM